MNIMKSVTMFMLEVRYHTGRDVIHFPTILGSKIASGVQAKPTMNLVIISTANDSIRRHPLLCDAPQDNEKEKPEAYDLRASVWE